MTESELRKSRNIGIVAHIDAGKTTTTERMLYYTGKVHKVGTVDEGTATMDWMVQEKERGITITSAATFCDWKDHAINIIDTPGHVDFTVEVERSMRVLDGLVVVFCAVGGVQTQTETVWRQANNYKIPRIVFVNKMDRNGNDYFRVAEQIRKKFGAPSVPITIPYFDNGVLIGVIDLIEMDLEMTDDDCDEFRKRLPIPDAAVKHAVKWRANMIERLADFDDAIAEKYLEETEISKEEIKNALRKATIEDGLVPTLCGTSAKYVGVQSLLDAIVYYLPSPLDVPPVTGIIESDGTTEIRETSDEAPFAALAFKIAKDPHVGHITYVRVYSGSIKKNSRVYNASNGKMDRITRILRMHSNRREELEELSAGSIGAVIGLKTVGTGDTLTCEENPILLEKIIFPEPVISVAIEAQKKDGHQKMSEALRELAKEDPTFKVESNKDIAQTIISGMGELHLEIITDRLKREFNVETTVGKPKVAFKETVMKTVEVEGSYVKQSGGSGHFGKVKLRVAPLPAGEGFIFDDEVKAGEIPEEYFGAIEKGVVEAMKTGVLGGYPVIDIHVTLLGGAFHEVDSNEQAFKIAGSIGLKNALRKAAPILKEPIMKVDIVVPEEFVGNVMQDVSSRRGRLAEMEQLPGDSRLLSATVPLSEMFGYSTILRNRTQGKGNFSMEFSTYQQVPASVSEELIKKGA
ncbi:MAG: elongation factor G [bacterium]